MKALPSPGVSVAVIFPCPVYLPCFQEKLQGPLRLTGSSLSETGCQILQGPFPDMWLSLLNLDATFDSNLYSVVLSLFAMAGEVSEILESS